MAQSLWNCERPRGEYWSAPLVSFHSADRKEVVSDDHGKFRILDVRRANTAHELPTSDSHLSPDDRDSRRRGRWQPQMSAMTVASQTRSSHWSR